VAPLCRVPGNAESEGQTLGFLGRFADFGGCNSAFSRRFSKRVEP